MKKIFNKNILLAVMLASGLCLPSCSLEEENPAGFTLEITAETIQGYESLINQCYFSMQRYFYGTDNWMTLTEGGTDLWTYQGNLSTTWTQWFWYFAGAAPNTTYTNGWWNGTYDGIGSCNVAISLVNKPPYKTEEERNAVVAQAYFLRAVYYFNAVEQFGGVTMITEPATGMNFHPDRTDPLTIYKEVIIPDLEFAFKWLPKGDDNTTKPTKKAALGFLAKACLQTIEYDAGKEYAAKALEYAKMLIQDAESGGAQYNAYMYEQYTDVFKESNNWTNKEALWKHRWYAGSDGHGSSNGNYKLNRNNEYFYCKVTNFGARIDDQATRLLWGGNQPGIFMPTQHLLELFVQEDGTLDPRFHESFQTEWDANTVYSWDESSVNRFDKVAAVKGKSLAVGDLAIKFIMPQDADYATESKAKHTSPYLTIDYKDVYNDAAKNINMTYIYQNPTAGYNSNGTSENLFNVFYPSLTKHNSSNYFVANAGNKRNGNLNATFIMRMAEVYLIAAEADLYVNGGSSALGYINKIRTRAGAKSLTGTPTIRTILDERGRELCGEYNRFYDLKRTGMLKDVNYLKTTHPDLAKFFKAEYALRPISTTYTEVLEGGGAYYQNPGY
ncbi:RagB/SusD family nutrient uptake outer membrane protein [Dysgonomonas macrotermitis]|uniref:Starch-binding associating with outer membrane n=1 Tax=Dysgonomonas macrotermitis TaxID=1346286 RepID=A0A1M4YP60_9BACT|nr:RagB/SusD family nutrient uptake outer membrane protein [Dysgonomonas macrotermitis]SHF07560.1 Starch-binding associating with outer membrane [Dysgonomonas macrotermitis]